MQLIWNDTTNSEDNPTRVTPDSENVGVQNAVAKAVQNQVHWSEIRALIAVCPDLPEACRQRLVSEGDAAMADLRCFYIV